jgi:desulfoferrodoxin-like iron-binding protein
VPKPISRSPFILGANTGAEPNRALGEKKMVNVQKAGEIYRCAICGNVVLVTEAGGGEIVCHGEPMQLVKSPESSR